MTGITPGGFEITANSYMSVIGTYNQETRNAFCPRNIVLLTSPIKERYEPDARYLTNYAEDSDIWVSMPHLVKISNDRLCVLWSEFKILPDEDNSYKKVKFLTTKCVIVDAAGNAVSDVLEDDSPIASTPLGMSGNTSHNAYPVYHEGKIYWTYERHVTSKADVIEYMDGNKKLYVFETIRGAAQYMGVFDKLQF